MNAQTQVEEHLANLAKFVRADMKDLHHRILGLAPGCRLWYLDGKGPKGKVVSNPSIGYGLHNCQRRYRRARNVRMPIPAGQLRRVR